MTHLPFNAPLSAAFSALNGALAITAGAFGAHGVEDAQASEWLRTGAAWQSVAALAGLFCAWRGAPLAAWLFVAGGLLFSGALYALALGAPSIMGAVAPVGGGSLILAWLALAWREFQDLRR